MYDLISSLSQVYWNFKPVSGVVFLKRAGQKHVTYKRTIIQTDGWIKMKCTPEDFHTVVKYDLLQNQIQLKTHNDVRKQSMLFLLTIHDQFNRTAVIFKPSKYERKLIAQQGTNRTQSCLNKNSRVLHFQSGQNKGGIYVNKV